MTRRLEISPGDVFNRWTVTGTARVSGRLVYLVTCICGNTGNVEGSSLVNSKSKSCGCLQKEVVRRASTKHGKTSSREYKSWEMMIQRCENPCYDGFRNYGANGVKICQEWKDFNNFFSDMGTRPPNTTLNRKIDPATCEPYKVYSKATCEWADNGSQAFDKEISERNHSGKTGVSFDKRSGKWRAYIGHNGVVHALGDFMSFEDAVRSRQAAELQYYGYLKN